MVVVVEGAPSEGADAAFQALVIAMPGTVELLTLAVAAAAGFVLLDAIIRRSLVGIGVVFVASVLYTTFPILPRQSLGGISILVWDMVSMLLLSAAIARLLRSRDISGLQWLLIAFGVVLLLSLVQGIFAYGLDTAVVEFRKHFHFTSIALYCSTIEPDRPLLDRIGYAWFAFAACLLLLSIARWAVLPLGLEGWAQGTGGLRVIGASPTLAILQAFLIGAVAWVRGSDASRWMRRPTPVLLASVVILQHRTVWAVLLVVVALAVLLERGAARKLLPLVGMGLLVIASLSITVLDREASELTEELGEQAGQRHTWEWRTEGWRALLEQSGPQEPYEFLIGRPFGGGWDRVVSGRHVTVSPHNLYVELYLRTGLLGLGVLGGLYVTALWRLGRMREANGLLARRVLFLMLVTHPIFFITYAAAQEQGIVIGLATAAASMASWRESGVKAHATERVVSE